jgi:phthalate 4,5-cis-dihydrodiol dehydrogenase
VKDAGWYGSARRGLRRAADGAEEAALKQGRNYGGAEYRSSANAPAPDSWYEHFGVVLVSCERADLRSLPNGVMVYGDDEARFEALAQPKNPRVDVIDELYAAVVDGRPPLHDGHWSMATVEVCLGILQSAREGREIALRHQVGIRR